MFGFILKWLKKPETSEEKKKRKEIENRERARKSALRVKVNLWRMWLAYLDRKRCDKQIKKLLERERELFEKWIEGIEKLQKLFYQIVLDLFNAQRKPKLEKLSVPAREISLKRKSNIQAERENGSSVEMTKLTPTPNAEVKKRARPWSNESVPPLDKNSQEYKSEKAKLDKLRDISQMAAYNNLSPAEANPELMKALAIKLGKCVCRSKPCVCDGEGGDDGTSNNGKHSNSKKQHSKHLGQDNDFQPS